MDGMGMDGTADCGISTLNKPMLLWLHPTTQSLLGEIGTEKVGHEVPFAHHSEP